MERIKYQNIYEKYRKSFELHLKEREVGYSHSILSEAIKYSLDAPGKRIRPVLLMMTLESFGISYELGIEAGLAVEMVHTYSLIHDDLPAMDDDDLRRGLPSNHKKYGEATAILAGDSLLTEAFHVLATSQTSADKKVKLIEELSQASGALGMCEGQQRDIDGENQALTIEELQTVHQLKTGKLFEYCTVAAGILAEASPKEQKLLREFAKNLGLAFQIRDDLLDVISTEEELGKKVGADEEIGKSTYPKLLGLEKANDYLESTLNLAVENIKELAEEHAHFDQTQLIQLAKSLELEGV